MWLRSCYFLLITETTIGYGDIHPFADLEMAFDIALVFLGSFLYWMLISFFATLASYEKGNRTAHTNLVSATEFLLQKQHPKFAQHNRVISSKKLNGLVCLMFFLYIL